MKTLLFIGGPADGQHIGMEEPLRPIYYIKKSTFTAPGHMWDRIITEKKISYRLETLACRRTEKQEEVFFFYVENSIKIPEMIKMLLNGYRRA